MAISSKERIKRKRQQLKDVLAHWNSSSEIMSATQNANYQAILDASCAQITNNILNRKWTSYEVMLSYCHKALEVHDALNCLTEIMFDRALQAAKLQDEKFEKTGKLVGKLHGVPVSVKDHVDVKGYDSTSGYSKFLFDACDEDAVIIQMLEKQGAIAFVKTNVCQFLMTFESSNPVYGRTLNLHNGDFTAGGSSCGEGALIGAGGSCLGVGSDLAGSLRIPSHFNGIYCLKPSFGRLPLWGNFHNGHNGCHEILPTLGPMARSIEDLEIFMEAVLELDPYKWDPLTVAFSSPFEKHDLWGKKLRIGYYTQNDVLTTSPACVRAVDMTVDVLRAQGYEVVPFEISNSFEACKSFFQWAGADGMKSYLISKEDDILEKGLSRLMAGFGLPSFINLMIIGLLKLFSQHRAAELVGTAKEVSVQKLYECQHELLLFRKSFMDYWNASGVDFVIAPGFSFPALPHDSFSETSTAGWSTAMYNVVNFSVGTIPVTTVMKDVDILPKDYLKNDLVEKIAYQYYDPEKMHGLPVGIQVIGGYREDEKTLAAMKVVDAALKNHKK